MVGNIEIAAATVYMLEFNVLYYSFMLGTNYIMPGPQFEGVSPPSEVLEQLLGKFAESREGAKKMTYSLPVRMKDKIRLHLLVLCLIIDDFSVEGSVLQKDLKITTNKLVK